MNVGWISKEAVTVTWLNRDQNQAILHVCEQKAAVESHFVCKQVCSNQLSFNICYLINYSCYLIIIIARKFMQSNSVCMSLHLNLVEHADGESKLNLFLV